MAGSAQCGFVGGLTRDLGRPVQRAKRVDCAARERAMRAASLANARCCMATASVGETAPNAGKAYAADVPDVLRDILERKVVEVAALKQAMAEDPAHALHAVVASKGAVERSRRFYKALDKIPGTLALIAEIKRRSPSKGHIGTISDAADLARLYYDAGASCISVLTDMEGFGGSLGDLREVVKAQERFRGDYPPPCPVLRKDFTIDEIQIAEAAEAGASAVLLIVAALGAQRTKELLADAHAYGLDVLVEVHSEDELTIAIDAGAEIIGVNNRDLRTFEVSLDVSARLKPLMPEGAKLVAESGIRDALDAWKLRDMGYHAILVGETLVTAYESQTENRNMYGGGYNVAKGLARALISKGSVDFTSPSAAAFYGAGEGAKESLGTLEM